MQYEACLRAARQLSHQLADGQRLSSVCPVCLTDFAYTSAPGHEPRLREDCRELFEGCVLMLMTPRAPDELARLSRRPGHCSQHKIRSDLPIDKLFMLILEALEYIVSTGLNIGDNAPAVRARKTQKAFANRAGRWPTRLDQLLPFGAESAVQWLLDLAEKRNFGTPLIMLTNLVVMARAVVLPVLLAESNRTRLLAILHTTLRMDDSWRGGCEPRSVAGALLHEVHIGPGSIPREFERLVSGCEAQLYSAVSEAVSCAPESLKGLDVLVDTCDKLHGMLGARAAGAPPERVQQHLSLARSQRAGKPLPSGRVMLALLLITQAAGAARCAAPGCGIAVLQSGDRAKFQVCARCRIPRYCSRGCQARAWRDGGGLPHRAVCAVLCKIDAHSFADRPTGAIQQSFARTLAQLSEGEIYVFNAWLTACRDEFGTATEVHSGPVDVRDPLRFLWNLLRYLSWSIVVSLCLIACGYRQLPIDLVFIPLFSIVCISFAD